MMCDEMNVCVFMIEEIDREKGKTLLFLDRT